jgi:hypothetical protein
MNAVSVMGHHVSTPNKPGKKGDKATVRPFEAELNLERGELSWICPARIAAVKVAVQVDKAAVIKAAQSRGQKLRVLVHECFDWKDVVPGNGVQVLDHPEDDRSVLIITTYAKKPCALALTDDIDLVFMKIQGDALLAKTEPQPEDDEDVAAVLAAAIR